MFVELHKTGCTHIRKLLSRYVSGRTVGKHNPPSFDPFADQRSFLGSVRNPWDWYVSLWAFGCDAKGGLYQAVTRNSNHLLGRGWRTNPIGAARSLALDVSRDPDVWKWTYSDVNDPQCFRRWLNMIHDSRYWRDYREGFHAASINSFAGLLTFRYLQIFCIDNKNVLDQISTYDDMMDFEVTYGFIDYFIRNESLERDLIDIVRSCGIELSESDENDILGSGRTNTSSRRRQTSYYYDDDSIELVSRRDRLIIDKFGYKPPAA